MPDRLFNEAAKQLILLSVCLIVKNEEEVLARCLDSVKDVAEEIIIVDTGSTDSTREIASRYTHHIYPFEWVHDFSAARNASLKRATGKWILVLDADEYFSSSDLEALKHFLHHEEVKEHVVYNIPIISFTGESLSSSKMLESSSDRLFPNHVGICYERPIHEQLTSTRPGVNLRYSRVPFRIYHTGYLQPVMDKKDKKNRNMNIFNKLKEQQTLEPYDHYTLANEYQAIDQHEMALEHYRQAFAGAPKHAAWYPHSLIALINTLFKLDKWTESWELVENQLADFKEYPEYYSIKGIHYESLGWFHEADACYRNAIHRAEAMALSSDSFWLFSPDYGCSIPYTRLIELSQRLHKPADYTKWLTKLLQFQPDDLVTLMKLLDWLSQTETAVSIANLLASIYNNPDDNRIYYLYQAAIAVGNLELVTHYQVQHRRATGGLSVSNQLKLALMHNSQQEWDEAFTQVPDKRDDSYIRNCLLASLVWKQPAYLTTLDIPSGHTYGSALKIVVQLLSGESLSNKSILSDQSDLLFLLAKELFLVRQYETYDEFISHVDSGLLINRLANYFYSRNQLEAAFNYYSILFQRDELTADSYENLGLYHVSQSLNEEASEFLSAACTLDPVRKHLYRSLISCSVEPVRSHFLKVFQDQFPHYVTLPFVQNL